MQGDMAVPLTCPLWDTTAALQTNRDDLTTQALQNPHTLFSQHAGLVPQPFLPHSALTSPQLPPLPPQPQVRTITTPLH